MFATSLSFAELTAATLVLVSVAAAISLEVQLTGDVLRSRDLSGAAKAAWAGAVVLVPLVGALLYLIARGTAMHEREVHALRAERQSFEDYIRSVASTKE